MILYLKGILYDDAEGYKGLIAIKDLTLFLHKVSYLHVEPFKIAVIF